ncbi:hypothetical protein OEZ85_006579 [Tetradesmus obliquus]|uniref:Uncharacterized protein n=1 Tax=Tetradesmus obliquus TaxID=3088 RepID=A0ABY8TVH2_TETOB|nr:hypothetical protein OEZ85_006579 [Tetradesmus obliquus]
MVPALARLLARSSTTAAADAFAAFQAANCLARLCSSEVAALRVAAVPAVVSGLVALLTVTEAARSRAVPLLFFLVRYDSATCRQLLEWPAAIAALASALDSKDSEDRRVAAEALTQMSKGDLWALAASCGTDANTYAAVLEATARKWATEMSGLLSGEAAGGPIGVQLSALATWPCAAASA